MLFKDMNLIKPIEKALEKSNYITATPIQEKAIPVILKKKDLLGIAQTGTGKTAAFVLPILQLMFDKQVKSNAPRTLILAPTRELAIQIGNSIEEYAKFTQFKYTVIFGGVKQFAQEKALKKQVDIIVATPGRLLDLMNQGFINLNKVEHFVLDEADRMLDMGFIKDMKKIKLKLPKNKQTLFFSATMSSDISKLTKDFLYEPVKVEITPQATTIDKIEQGIYFVDKEDKNNLLFDIVKSKEVKSVIVFTRTKHKANKIAEFLNNKNINALAIHGNKSQAHREKALSDFKSSKIKVLVATEIAARGIDVDNLSHVINYELPNEPESYVHRIGRTARAGARGVAYSFCEACERNYLREIEKLIKKTIKVVKHNKHSEFAQNAKGTDAKPKPKTQVKRTKPLKKKIDIKEEKNKFLNKNPKKKWDNKNTYNSENNKVKKSNSFNKTKSNRPKKKIN